MLEAICIALLKLLRLLTGPVLDGACGQALDAAQKRREPKRLRKAVRRDAGMRFPRSAGS